MKLSSIYNNLILVFFFSVFAGCTQVELCDKDVHPHLARVSFSYDWSLYRQEKPDSMLVVVSRIVNTFHSSFCLSSDGEPPVNPTANQTGLKSGEYFMMTFNKSDRLTIQNLDTFLVDNSVSLRDLSIRMKTLKREEIPQLAGKTWVDFNPGYNYVSNEGEIFLAKVDNIKLFTDVPAKLEFTPKPLTQKINFEFQLVVVPDSVTGELPVLKDVIAEMSGVATTIYPVSEVVKSSSLGRFIFNPRNVSHVDSVYSYKGLINAFGLLPGEDPDAISGSGILRLGIYLNVGGKEKILRASVNLSKQISDLGLVKPSEDGTGVTKAKEEATIVVGKRLRITTGAVEDNYPDGISGWHVESFIDFDV